MNRSVFRTNPFTHIQRHLVYGMPTSRAALAAWIPPANTHKLSSVERMAKYVNPKSMPTLPLTFDFNATASSQSMETGYRPAESLETVAVVSFPALGRVRDYLAVWQRNYRMPFAGGGAIAAQAHWKFCSAIQIRALFLTQSTKRRQHATRFFSRHTQHQSKCATCDYRQIQRTRMFEPE